MAVAYLPSFKDVLFRLLFLFIMSTPIFTQDDCHEDFCLLPKPRKDGTYNTEIKKYRYGERIVYNCLYVNGHRFGSSSLECGKNGYWQGEEPHCAYQEEIISVEHDSGKHEQLFDKVNTTCTTTGKKASWNVKTNLCTSGLTVIKIIIQVIRTADYSDFMKTARVSVRNCQNKAEIAKAFERDGNLYLQYTFKCNVKDETCQFQIIPTSSWYEINLCEIYIYRKPKNICPSNIKICNGGTNDTIDVTGSRNYHRVPIYCNEGYILEGRGELHCTDGILFGLNETKCSRISCNSTPPLVVNGKWSEWSHSKLYYYGDRLVVTCDSSYIFNSGLNFTQCQKDGSWSIADAVCLREEVMAGLLIPIAISIMILVVLVIILIPTCIWCSKRRNSEKQKDKTAEDIYSEPSYCTSELSVSSQRSPPLPPPNPHPFYSDPVDTYYAIDDDAHYYEPYTSINDNQVTVSQNKTKGNPIYVIEVKDSKSKEETSGGYISSYKINKTNQLYSYE